MPDTAVTMIAADADPTAPITRRLRLDLPLCPTCGAGVVSHGRRRRRLFDAPQGSRPLVLAVDAQRGWCPRCGLVQARHPDQHGDRAYTTAFAHYVALNGLERGNAWTARRAGISPTMVRELVTPVAERLAAWWGLPAPTYLGIDEAYEKRKARFTLVDLSTGAILLVGRGRTIDSVHTALSSMRGLEACRGICVDLWGPYATAVNLLRKQRGLSADRLVIVADRIHVCRDFTQSMLDVWHALPRPSGRGSFLRKRGEEELLRMRAYQVRDSPRHKALQTEVFASRPALKAAWLMREWALSVFDLGDKNRALATWDRFREHVEGTDPGPMVVAAYEAMREKVRKVERRRQDVFAAWDIPIHNNRTEGSNRLIDPLIERGGYSDLILNAKLRFLSGAYTPTMIAQALADALPAAPPSLEVPPIAPRRGTPLAALPRP